MSESYVQLPPDSTGKKLRAMKKTVGSNEVFEEVQQSLLRGITEAPPDKQVTKKAYTYDDNDDLETVKYYDGTELLFTLTYSYFPLKKIIKDIVRS